MQMWSLKTGGLWRQIQLLWNIGSSARNIWSFKTGAEVVSRQASLYTVTTVTIATTCPMVIYPSPSNLTWWQSINTGARKPVLRDHKSWKNHSQQKKRHFNMLKQPLAWAHSHTFIIPCDTYLTWTLSWAVSFVQVNGLWKPNSPLPRGHLTSTIWIITQTPGPCGSSEPCVQDIIQHTTDRYNWYMCL